MTDYLRKIGTNEIFISTPFLKERKDMEPYFPGITKPITDNPVAPAEEEILPPGGTITDETPIPVEEPVTFADEDAEEIVQPKLPFTEVKAPKAKESFKRLPEELGKPHKKVLHKPIKKKGK